MKRLLAGLLTLVSITLFAHPAKAVVVDLEYILNDYYNHASILKNDHLANGIMKRIVKQYDTEEVVWKWSSYEHTDFLGNKTYVRNPVETELLVPDYRVREIIDFSETPLTTCYILEEVKTGEAVTKSAAIGRIRSRSCGPACEMHAAPTIKSAKFRANALIEMLKKIGL